MQAQPTFYKTFQTQFYEYTECLCALPVHAQVSLYLQLLMYCGPVYHQIAGVV